MRCPKCHYLGYASGDRCRHCGYDFSLAASRESDTELPLRHSADDAPLADLAIGGPDSNPDAGNALREEIDSPSQGDAPAVDLPLRGNTGVPVEGAATPAAPPGRTTTRYTERLPADPVREWRSARADTPAPRRSAPTSAETPRLFDPRGSDTRGDARPPAAPVRPPPAVSAPLAASAGVRCAAAAVDLGLFAVLSVIVLLLALRVAGLSPDEWVRLPMLPLAGFLLLLAAGYATGFTAASGQTIGKMALGVRVVGLDGRIVPIQTALRRFGGQCVSLFGLGLGFVPVITDSDRRAFHDRIAGTRVIDA